MAEEGSRVARVARCVLVSLLSRRADGCTRMRCPLSRGMYHQLSLEAVMEMQQHLDETGLSLHLLCTSYIWVCTMFDQSLLSLH